MLKRKNLPRRRCRKPNAETVVERHSGLETRTAGYPYETIRVYNKRRIVFNGVRPKTVSRGKDQPSVLRRFAGVPVDSGYKPKARRDLLCLTHEMKYRAGLPQFPSGKRATDVWRRFLRGLRMGDHFYPVQLLGGPEEPARVVIVAVTDETLFPLRPKIAHRFEPLWLGIIFFELKHLEEIFRHKVFPAIRGTPLKRKNHRRHG